MPEAEYKALSVIDQNNERLQIDPNNLPFVQNIAPGVNNPAMEQADEVENVHVDPIDARHQRIIMKEMQSLSFGK